MADDRRHVAAQLAGEGWAGLEVVEAVLARAQREGDKVYPRLLFPDTLQKRRADGSWENLPVRYCVLDAGELRAARAQAHKLAAEDGIDPRADPVEFGNLQEVCVLWRALREPTPPYEPVGIDPRDLEKRLPMPTLLQAKGQYNHWELKVDPRPDDIDESEMVVLAAAITESRDVRPLLAYGGRSREKFIVFTASRLTSSLVPSSSPPPAGPSTPAP